MESIPPEPRRHDSYAEKQRTLAALLRLRNALVETASILRDVHFIIDERAAEEAARDMQEVLKKSCHFPP